jgi:prophage regulatory protein
MEQPTTAEQYTQLPSGNLGSERLLRRDEVLATIGLSRAWLYSAVSKGQFPRPLRLGARATGWRETDVAQWLGRLECASRANLSAAPPPRKGGRKLALRSAALANKQQPSPAPPNA